VLLIKNFRTGEITKACNRKTTHIWRKRKMA